MSNWSQTSVAPLSKSTIKAEMSANISLDLAPSRVVVQCHPSVRVKEELEHPPSVPLTETLKRPASLTWLLNKNKNNPNPCLSINRLLMKLPYVNSNNPFMIKSLLTKTTYRLLRVKAGSSLNLWKSIKKILTLPSVANTSRMRTSFKECLPLLPVKINLFSPSI